MTGVRPDRYGFATNFQSEVDWTVHYPDKGIQQRLKDLGYRTFSRGKVYHRVGSGPTAPGWDEITSDTRMEGENQGLDLNINLKWGPSHDAYEDTADYRTVSDAIADIERCGGDPFFIACGLFKPHTPWFVPQTYLDQVPLETVVLPAHAPDDLDDLSSRAVDMARTRIDDPYTHRQIVDANQWKSYVRAYLALVRYVDDLVGRLLDAVDASERGDDTLIVLLSDHGWMHGQKEAWRKFKPWEQAVRSNLMLAGPGVPVPGARIDAAVSLLDIYPTVMELIGEPVPDHCDGRSLRPLLEDPATPWDHPVTTVVQAYHHRADSIRSNRFRYIEYITGERELYDHADDPHEWTNLVENPAYASTVSALRRYQTFSHPEPVDGRVEFEDLPASFPRGYGSRRVNRTDPRADQGAYVDAWMRGRGSDREFAFVLRIPESGTWSLSVRHRTGPDQGTWQLGLEGEVPLPAVDAFRAGTERFDTVNLGAVSFVEPGLYEFRVRDVGTHPDGHPNRIGLDSLQLQKTSNRP